MAKDLSMVQVVSRGQWGAKPCKGYETLKVPVDNVVAYHRVWPKECHDLTECSTMMRELQIFHQKSDLSDMHWNFLIGSDGVVYEGRGWLREPSKCVRNHAYDYNNYEVGFIGDFEKTPVPEVMRQTLDRWIELGISKGYLKPSYNLVEDKEMLPLIRHKSYKNGLRLTFDYSWISKGKKKKQAKQVQKLKDKKMWMHFDHVPVFPKLGLGF